MNKIELIAELSWNHIGNMETARLMILAAKEAGADYVKFQTWKVDRLKPGPWDRDGRREIYKKAELSQDDHFYLKGVCEEVGINFLTSCFCEEDLKFIRKLSNEVKIPSPECFNQKLIEGAVAIFDHVIVSTGAATKSEYESLIRYSNLTLLHCVSSYPCLPEHFHWDKFFYIKSLTSNFGFSGHMTSIWDAIMAISHGAKIIEKHFTIDRQLPGRDNKFALLPEEFRRIREFADLIPLMKSRYALSQILECEQDYRTYHQGRWSKINEPKISEN